MSRQYLNAAKVVKAVLSGGSLKQYCSQKKVGKEEYALACETLKYNDVIDIVLADCESEAERLNVDEFVLKVMFYELFFGKRKIQGGGTVKRIILSKFSRFETSLQGVLRKRGKSEYNQLLSELILQSSNLPKYVRINVIKMNAISGFEEIKSRYPQVFVDPDIPSLLTIPSPHHGISDLASIIHGSIIIQDKASCIPSQILIDEWDESGQNGDFIDACAAPGNKTSHLSALSWNSQTQTFKNHIFAFDRNTDRCTLLESRMNQAGAANVYVSCANFLDIDTTLPIYERVTCILVDPSCSGSGVVRSLERVLEHPDLPRYELPEDQTDERLLKLSKFQISVISKALQFPSVSTVVSSTCSIHQIENEAVVVEILKNNPDWELKCPPRFRSWKRKGLRCSGLLQSQADCLIRCHPEDGMNGFFVALFVRKSSQPTAKYKRSIPQVCRQGKRRRVVTVKWKPIHKLI